VRLIFAALLLLNIAFFAWAHWIDTPTHGAAAVTPDASIPSLQLMHVGAPSGTASGASTAAVTSSATTAADTAAPLRCRSLGPFVDEATTSAAAQRLQARGWTAHERNVESATPDSYWVYVSNLQDAAAQRRMIATLNAAGIRDAAIMTEPAQSDRVSVGVFADQAHAVRRAEQVRALGFKPTLQVHQRTLTQRWLDLELKVGDSDPSPEQVLQGISNPDGSSLGTVQIADCSASRPNG
jgi:SPOR domain